MKAREVVEMLENLCPKHYALGWDNPGMHVGHWDNQVKKVLIAVDADDEIIGYEFVNLGKMMDAIKKGTDANEALKGATGTYGRVADAAKMVDPRHE